MTCASGARIAAGRVPPRARPTSDVRDPHGRCWKEGLVMKPGLLYATLRRHLRDSVTHRDAVLEAFRTVRYLAVQGPWQPLVVRWHQAFGHNPPFRAASSSMLSPFDVGSAVRGLHRDAYAPGFRVPGETVEEIVRFVRA